MFISARMKLGRADHHIHDLETQFAAFTDSTPYALSVGNSDGETIMQVRFREPIPPQWALIIGDAIHNTRTALDHMVWELFRRDGGEQDRHVKFPTGSNRTNFEATCDGLRTPNQVTRDLLKALEVFPGGQGETLYYLNQFDNGDKHTVLTLVIQSAEVPEYVIYNALGQAEKRLGRTVYVDGDTGHVNIGSIPPGGHIEIENETKVTPKVTLDKTNPLGGYEPALELLRGFQRATRQTIDGIELSIR